MEGVTPYDMYILELPSRVVADSRHPAVSLRKELDTPITLPGLCQYKVGDTRGAGGGGGHGERGGKGEREEGG